MSIFKLKVVGLFGLIGIACILLGIYMATVGEVPSMGGSEPIISLEGIDRFMGLYPFGLGLILCFKAKWEFEKVADMEK